MGSGSCGHCATLGRSSSPPCAATPFGPGFQIALGADIRIIAPEVQLGSAEIDFGMTVDMGASRLPLRVIGNGCVTDLLLTGRRITGAEALSWGLASRLSDDPLTEAPSISHAITQRSGHAVVQIKRHTASPDPTSGVRRHFSG